VTVSRRTFLTGSAAVATAVGLGRALPAAAGKPPVAATGPLADVYGYLDVPRGRALGLAGSGAGARTVTWLTTGAPTAQVVEWGVVPPGAPEGRLRNGSLLKHRATASSATAPGGRFDDSTGQTTAVEGEHPVQVHRAELTGLPSGTQVAYRVGHPSTGWSEVELLAVPAADAPFVLAHFGDHGVTAASRRTTAAVRDRRPDALLLAGDISYANGNQPTWDRWAGLAEPMTSIVPLLPVPGNHEAKDYYGETYRTRFTTPRGGANWWSADLGRAHVFAGTAGCFLTENDPTTARDLVVDELVAMEQALALAAVRRGAGEIDFLVVAQHFPLYTNHDTRGPFSPELVVAQEHILQRYQVDMVLVGHDHMYQRSSRMAYGRPTGTAAGYVQMCVGAGGNGLYDFAQETDSDWGTWCEVYSRKWSWAEYLIERDSITATVHCWDDPTADTADPNPNAVDVTLPSRVLDTMVLRRKDDGIVAAAAAARTRSALEIVKGVPEVRGKVVRNLAEDCTRHHH